MGKPVAVNRAIHFPLAELHTEAETIRILVYKTAWHLDRQDHMVVSDAERPHYWTWAAPFSGSRVCGTARRPRPPCRRRELSSGHSPT